MFFKRNWWPHGEVLVQVPELGGWHSVRAYPAGSVAPGIVVFRWEAPLFFANAGQFRDQVRALVRDHSPSVVVLQCEAVTDIDVTAAEVLEDLDRELNDRGVHLAFVELRDRLRSLVTRYGLDSTLDREHFYPSIEVAIRELADERDHQRRSGGTEEPDDPDADEEPVR